LAQFFSVASCFDTETEIIEFVLRRYNNADYIFKMNINDFVAFLIRAKEVETDERIHTQWANMLPYMSLGQLKYISFEDYKDKCTGKNIDTRSTAEIVAELEELHGRKLV